MKMIPKFDFSICDMMTFIGKLVVLCLCDNSLRNVNVGGDVHRKKKNEVEHNETKDKWKNNV